MKEITLGEWKIKNKTYTNKNARIYEKIKYREYKINDEIKIEEDIYLERFIKEFKKGYSPLLKDFKTINYTMLSVIKNNKDLIWIQGKTDNHIYGYFDHKKHEFEAIWGSKKDVLKIFIDELKTRYNLNLNYNKRNKNNEK